MARCRVSRASTNPKVRSILRVLEFVIKYDAEERRLTGQDMHEGPLDQFVNDEIVTKRTFDDWTPEGLRELVTVFARHAPAEHFAAMVENAAVYPDFLEECRSDKPIDARDYESRLWAALGDKVAS